MAAKTNKKDILEKGYFAKKIFIVVSSILMSVVIFVLGYYLYIDISYKDKFLPNTRIAGIDFSGKTKSNAEEVLTSKMQDWSDASFNILGDKNKEWQIANKNLEVAFNLENTISHAYYSGRNGNIVSQIWNRISRMFFVSNNEVSFSKSDEDIKAALKNVFQEAEISGVNVGLSISGGEIKETSETIGKRVREKGFLVVLKSNIGNLLSSNIELSFSYVFPSDNIDSLARVKDEINTMISSSLTLVYKDKKWFIDKPLIEKWISIQNVENTKNIESSKYKSASSYINNIWDQDGITFFIKGSSEASLDKDRVLNHLSDVASTIDVKAQNATLSFVDNKVVVSAPSHTGLALDKDNAYSQIVSALKNKVKKVNLVVGESTPQVREDNISDLGITELIGQGKSDFSGSTASRINNVKVGASKFNSVLVAPGEEFSVVKTLGDVDASTGFLPELVIKPGKLVKEYGGGLCQVATTAFRAALYAGLPITERKNHSYVVHYYFWPFPGPGTDATIYGPHPDLRFKNDTGHYILIQTYTQGNKLFFDYYGTKGNRSATIDGPYTLSSNPDGSATTVFYRNVLENGILKKRDTFNSYYKPAAEFKLSN